MYRTRKAPFPSARFRDSAGNNPTPRGYRANVDGGCMLAQDRGSCNLRLGAPASMVRSWLVRISLALMEQGIRRARRILGIRGQAPRVEWQPNADGVKRTIEEAVEIARKNRV
jgi:hypothetical protein